MAAHQMIMIGRRNIMGNNGIGTTLKDIETLTKTILSVGEDDRVLVYKRIDPHLLSMESRLKESPDLPLSTKIDELKVHLIAMARLDDPDGYPDEHHYARALEVIEDLRGHFGSATV